MVGLLLPWFVNYVSKKILLGRLFLSLTEPQGDEVTAPVVDSFFKLYIINKI